MAASKLDDDTLDHLKSLQTGAIDARNGYEEALEGQQLSAAGEKPDESGSFMSTVHRTIMDVRSLFGGLDDSVLPGLIDGEKRNVAAYDEALNKTRPSAELAGLLADQREHLVAKSPRCRR